MKIILEKSYKCLIYIFFALFVLLVRIDADNHKTMFSISMMVGAIIFAGMPFIINKCKKIEVRRWYLMSVVSISIFVILESIYLLLLDNMILANYENYKQFNLVCVWILRFSQAIFITFTIFDVIYTFKDFFKKDYEIQKFDLDAIMMIFNLLASIAIVYIVYDYSGYRVLSSIKITNYILSFGLYDIVLNGILITSAIYIVAYIIIETIKYFKFERREDKSNNLYK